MQRRDFLGVLGGVAAWPLAVRAQQTRILKVGLLYPGLATSAVARVAAFREGLHNGGIPGMSFRRQAAPLHAEIFRKDFRDCQFVAPGCLPRIEIQYSCHGNLLSVIFTPRKILTRKMAR